MEDERRRGSKTAREAQTAAQADIVKLKHALAEAEQQMQEAVRQCEAEAHRNAVKLAQAGRNLKAAKNETADAQKQAKVTSSLLACQACFIVMSSRRAYTGS